MIRRPKEWEKWTQEKRMKWLRTQRTTYNGGRKRSLKKKDREKVWTLIKETNNMSIVADILEVDRSTVYRFLNRHPMPNNFVIPESMNLKDFVEIQTWLYRLEGFAGPRTMSNYIGVVRKFFEWMKQHYPDRAKPSLWTSDDMLEFIYGNIRRRGHWEGFKPHQWHRIIVPLRSLALKAPKLFPNIDLGLLPTKKTHKAKRSLAGKKEYYYTPEQISKMIEVASTRKAKALIAFLYNTACRCEGLINTRIENLFLDRHMAKIKDKGAQEWLVYGLTDRTIQLVKEYLEGRGWPKSGWLFNNGNGKQLTEGQVNDIIRELGAKACIKDKVLTSRSFRKSFVKNALDAGINPMSLIGTGKETKTCMCVGWSSDIIFKHYAPQMLGQIEEDRSKFLF